MAVPENAGDVVTAMRLGWNLAEARGRNRPDAPPGANAGLPGPPSHALPLHIEQSPAELRIQAQGVVATMAKKLGVDLGIQRSTRRRRVRCPGGFCLVRNAAAK
jgi:hypothetical protein